MKYLGIDYGKSKIGLALSEGLTASPFKILYVNSLKDALSQVGNVIRCESIEGVIIGVPDSGEARSITEKFIKELESDVPVIRADETLSTHHSKGKKNEDAIAAAFILQNYLDEQ